MFLLFSPFTFLFLAIYIFFILSLPSVPSVFNFWLIIEFSTLLFLGISYTVFLTSVSSLMLYFFVQTTASFTIIIAFLYSQPFLLLAGVLLKLGMFPFVTWYVASLSLFPSPSLWLAMTFQNLPPLLLLSLFPLPLPLPALMGAFFATAIVSGSLMFSSPSLRLLLISSSVGNNSWLVLGVLSSLPSFVSFFTIYATLLSALLLPLKALQPLFPSPSLLLPVVALSGLPPSPLFFPNVLIIFLIHPLVSSPFLVVFLLLSSISALSYVSFSLRLSSFSLRL